LRRTAAARVAETSHHALAKEEVALLEMQRTRTDTMRVLNGTCRKFKCVRQAILERTAGGRTFGSMEQLPGAVLTPLAEAQQYQLAIYTTCRDSVRREVGFCFTIMNSIAYYRKRTAKLEFL